MSKPTSEKNWVKEGDTVVSVFLSPEHQMRGVVKRVIYRRSLPSVRVVWANGAVGIHTITTLKKVSP